MPVPPGDDVPAEESIYDSPKMAPFDPEDYTKASTDPPESVPADNPSAERDEQEEAEAFAKAEGEEESEEPEEDLPAFDPRVRDEFKGLLYLGALTSEFEWLGHSFKIRTLTVGEFLEVGMATKRYEGTMGYDRAWQAAVVSACIISIDGRPMPIPVTTDPSDSHFANAFRYVLDRWFAPTIEAVYARYVHLELTVGRVVEAMGKATG